MEKRAEDFRKERPLVWLAIRANCSMSIIEQQALEAKLREVLSRKVYIDLDRDLDLLLALIMYLSWYVSIHLSFSHLLSLIWNIN